MKTIALAIITILAAAAGAVLRWFYDTGREKPIKDSFEFKKEKIKERISEIDEKPLEEITDAEVDLVIDNFISMTRKGSDK